LQGHKNFSLADLALAYTYKNVRYSLDWTNILNTSKYVSAWYGNLNSYYSEYNIRPAQVMLNMQFKLF
jgi:glutathione S-transferase